MNYPSSSALMDRLGSLPAGAVLLGHLRDASGVHLVGGAVRDLLIDGEPTDLDLVVEGDAAVLAKGLDAQARVHDRFGSATVILEGFSYDIVGSRRESYAQPGALPDVIKASLAEDLRRRDFSVNAIAMALGGPLPGELHSVPSALEDLRARRLRVLHARSFTDDPTRLFRLTRYASRLGFDVAAGTLELAQAAVRAGAVATVSGSRIGAELRLVTQEDDPLLALRALGEIALDSSIDPRFRLSDPALAARALELLPADGRRDLLALALAAREIPGDELGVLLDSLAYEASARELVLSVVSGSEEIARALLDATLPSEIAIAVSGAGPEVVALAGALGAEVPARRWLQGLRDVRLEIDGADLLAAGVQRGPAIGHGLQSALAAKLDGLAIGRAAELAEALRAAGER